MNIVVLLMPMALILASLFLFAFIWAVKKGQFEDLESPAHKMLMDENKLNFKNTTKTRKGKMS